jgi:hypothetical protein
MALIVWADVLVVSLLIDAKGAGIQARNGIPNGRCGDTSRPWASLFPLFQGRLKHGAHHFGTVFRRSDAGVRRGNDGRNCTVCPSSVQLAVIITVADRCADDSSALVCQVGGGWL